MPNDRIFNFSSGPSMLPLPVLERAAREITNYRGSGESVMEMSHRSKTFIAIYEEAVRDLRRVLAVPDDYDALFMHGGATMQFAAVPMNLIGRTGKADYAVTGNFSALAMKEAEKYGDIRVAATSEDRNHSYIPARSEIKIAPDSSYFYYCANNTVYGTEWKYAPETGDVPIVCDMSSNILSKPVDVGKYGVILAGVQKNMAPAGMSVVIVRKDLLGRELPVTPNLLNYAVTAESGSMLNTPPCWTIYMLGLVLKWVDSEGGLPAMEARKIARAKILYDALDASPFYTGCAEKDARSDMNVTFRTPSEELDAKFAKEAAAAGFDNLKGHRAAGGLRASVYNAMPTEGAVALAGFMREFERNNG